MQISPDTVSVNEWLNEPSITPESRKNRKYVLMLFERANHATFAEILEKIKEDTLTPYSASKQFLDAVRKKRSPLTVYVYRSMIVTMFESVLGEENFRRRVMDRLCPTGAVYVSRVKKAPNREQLTSMLKTANPKFRAIIGVLAVSGMRIGEVLSRKMSDLEIREHGYARLRLQAGQTKARYQRYTFLTREVLEWVQINQRVHPSEYLFGGRRGKPLRYPPCANAIKDLYAKVGLKDAPDKSEIYCTHSFRTFASDLMRDCGLPEKYCLAIVGHRAQMGSESSYVSWDNVEKAWVEKCADKISFLSNNGAEQKQEIDRLNRHNGKLEALLERMLERLDLENLHKP